MPAFNPLAGFSPSCCAVLVQTEHCADATSTDKINRSRKAKNRMVRRQLNMVRSYASPFEKAVAAVKLYLTGSLLQAGFTKVRLYMIFQALVAQCGKGMRSEKILKPAILIFLF